MFCWKIHHFVCRVRKHAPRRFYTICSGVACGGVIIIIRCMYERGSQAGNTHIHMCRAGCLPGRSFALFLVCAARRPLVHSRWLKVRAKCCTMAPTLNLEPIHTYIFNATIIDPLMDVLRSLWLLRENQAEKETESEKTRRGWKIDQTPGKATAATWDKLFTMLIIYPLSHEARARKAKNYDRACVQDWIFQLNSVYKLWISSKNQIGSNQFFM